MEEPIEVFIFNKMLQTLYELKEEKPENMKTKIEEHIIFYENILFQYDKYLRRKG